MNRRSFLHFASTGAGLSCLAPLHVRRTHHLILIGGCGGVRKRDYYENPKLCPNFYRLTSEAFVFEEDHCERVASHSMAFLELLQGRENRAGKTYPTILDYVGNGVTTDSIRSIPWILQRFRPRVVVCREAEHDVGHDSYEKYLSAVRLTDQAIGLLFDWVKHHPGFSSRTAIVFRPEFGRDDEVNAHGQLHHSYGFYDTHRVASIFWGPDFNRGVDRKTVVSALDMAPTLARIFGVEATEAQGRILPGLFRTT